MSFSDVFFLLSVVIRLKFIPGRLNSIVKILKVYSKGIFPEFGRIRVAVVLLEFVLQLEEDLFGRSLHWREHVLLKHVVKLAVKQQIRDTVLEYVSGLFTDCLTHFQILLKNLPNSTANPKT